MTIGLSGGVDSMVLLHLLLREMPPEQIVVAHFNHLVRPTSTEEVKWLKKKCQSLGVTNFYSARRKGKKISEASLRGERLDFLNRIRIQTGSDVVVLGHHANDQLETILMRLIRGTGIYGLGGIRIKSGKILRPLLPFSREEIETFASKHRIEKIEDESNHSEIYFRNRVRHRLIPVLRELSELHGGEKRLLLRVNQLSEEVQALRKEEEQRAKKWIARHLLATPAWLSVAIDKWKKLPLRKQELVAQMIWKKYTGEALEKKQVKQFIACVAEETNSVLSKNVKVVFSCGFLYFQFPRHTAYQDKVSKCRDLLSLICRPSNKKVIQTFLEEHGAEVRFVRPGDYYKGKKIKRRFLKEGIPLPERTLMPVVALRKSREVLWYFPRKDSIGKAIWVPWSSLN